MSTTTLEKLEELIYHGFQETDLKFQETDRKFQERDAAFNKNLDKLRREIANISDNLGRFAENMVSPAIVHLFNKRGIPIVECSQRVRSPKRRIEYDIVAINSEFVVVVSVKMTLRVAEVRFFLEERLPIFKEVFPHYKNKKILGAVAGASIVQEADTFAMKQGLFVLAQSGENIVVLNDSKFQPKVF